jgi:hypothetical protein
MLVLLQIMIKKFINFITCTLPNRYGIIKCTLSNPLATLPQWTTVRRPVRTPLT